MLSFTNRLGRLSSQLGMALASAALIVPFSSAANAREATAPATPSFASEDLWLETIGYRLAAANASRCAEPEMLTGLILHDMGAYEPAARPAVAKALGLSYGFGVRQLVPGSSGARAGLRQNDEILALDGRDLKDFEPQLIGIGARYDRVERFVTLLGQALTKGPAMLTVRRGGTTVTLSLVGKAGCGGRFTVAAGRDLNAWADGKYVAVTTRMMRYAKNDDELAFVVAHEMAHNILHHGEHAGGGSGLFAELGFGAKAIKADEIAADSYAVGLLAAAGYDLAAPERFLRRSGKFHWLDLATTHPGTGRRVATVRSAIARLDASRPAGAPVESQRTDAGQPGLVATRTDLPPLQTRAPVRGLANVDLAAPFGRQPSSAAIHGSRQRIEVDFSFPGACSSGSSGSSTPSA
jgi:hypothetical protein